MVKLLGFNDGGLSVSMMVGVSDPITGWIHLQIRKPSQDLSHQDGILFSGDVFFFQEPFSGSNLDFGSVDFTR